VLEIEQDREEETAGQKVSLGIGGKPRFGGQVTSINHMSSLQDGKKQNSKQESVVLKVDVVHDQETRM
jgi:hypothetical protein